MPKYNDFELDLQNASIDILKADGSSYCVPDTYSNICGSGYSGGKKRDNTQIVAVCPD